MPFASSKRMIVIAKSFA